MCGRYTLTAEASELVDEFDLADVSDLVPRYNIAPSQSAPIVRVHGLTAGGGLGVVRLDASGSVRQLDVLRWGLIPSWAKDAKIGFSTINARAETIATQPAFRDAFRQRRCIIPASGFYEWQKAIVDGKEVKLPHYIRRRDGRLLAIAGLWERWTDPQGKIIETFTVITTSANDLIRPLHDRMPVILRREDCRIWLDPATPPTTLHTLLAPCPAEWLFATPVSRAVNNPRNDSPACIEGTPP